MADRGPVRRPFAWRAPALALAALLLGTGGSGGARADIPDVVLNPANGHYYKWVSGTTTWMNGKAGAETLGGYLATVTSSAEQAWLRQNIVPAGQSACLGGTDETVEGTWAWITGEAWAYANWGGGEPNNVGNEDYLAMTGTGPWNDVVGSSGGMSGYVVEWNENPNIPPPPAAPTALSAVLQGDDDEVLLTWTDDSTNEASFQLERKTAAGTFGTVANPAAGATTHVDADVFPGVSYTWRVRAVNAGGTSAWSNEATVAVPAAASAPVAPSDLVALAATPTSVTLGWTDNSDDETGFEVHRRNAAGAYVLVATTAADAVQSLQSGLSPDTTCGYRVRAVNGNGVSGFTEADVSTPPTLSVATVRADLKDSPKFGKDSLKLQATFDFLEASDGSCDPVTEGLVLRAGAAAGPVVFQLPAAGAAEWKVSATKAVWKSPKGSVGKYKVEILFAERLVKFTASGLNLPAAAENPVRVSLAIGNDAGTENAAWVVKKAGFLQYR